MLTSKDWQDRREEIAADLDRSRRSDLPCAAADARALEAFARWVMGKQVRAVERERWKGTLCQ